MSAETTESTTSPTTSRSEQGKTTTFSNAPSKTATRGTTPTKRRTASTKRRTTPTTKRRTASALAPTGEQPRRSSGSLGTAKARWRYWSIMIGLIIASAAIALGLLAWDNP
ncbi:MAG: hypothetical protein ACTIKI_09915, partial [Brevibacterium aurantiacum]